MFYLIKCFEKPKWDIENGFYLLKELIPWIFLLLMVKRIDLIISKVDIGDFCSCSKYKFLKL